MIALRESPEIWNTAPPLAKTARRPETLAPRTRCDRCACWMSRYRQLWEDRCLPCQDAEPCDPPLAEAGAGDPLLAAVAREISGADQDQRVAELDQPLEQSRAERAAKRAARPVRPLSADHEATRERWAAWREERGDADPACRAARRTT